MKKVLFFAAALLAALSLNAESVYDWAEKIGSETIVSESGEDGVAITTVKTEANTTEVACIKFGKSYKSGELHNYLELTSAKEKFLKDDIIIIQFGYNNSASKKAIVGVFDTEDNELATSGEGKNMRNENGSSEFTFTLPADMDKIRIARGTGGNTGTCVISLTVVRGETVKPIAPSFSKASGIYYEPFKVGLHSSRADKIYYAKDGGEYQEYTDSIEISTYDVEVKLSAYSVYNGENSEITEATYTLEHHCGDNLTWTLDNKGNLTISGTGDMYDYYGDVPWPRESIYSVSIGYGVTSIGRSAFYGCNSLTSVTIPNSVTSIGFEAFYGCSSLTSVTIPNSVTSIGIQAFYSCESLTSVTIPNSVTSIEEYAFYGCSITSINFNGKIEELCNRAWHLSEISYNYQLYLNGKLQEEVIIPNSVTSIGSWAFNGCSSLTSITIPNSVTSIGEYAFNGCSSLTSVTIESEQPCNIGRYAFDPSTAIYVPCGTLSAYKNSWSDYSSQISYQPAMAKIGKCENGSVYIGDTYYKDGWSLSMCDKLIEAKANNGYYFVSWQDGNTYNPRTIDVSKDVTYTPIFKPYINQENIIASGTCGDNLTWTLDNKGNLTISGTGDMYSYYRYTNDYEWETSGTNIPWFSFNVTTVNINNGVTSIGQDAFAWCSSLTSVTIPNSVTSIGNGAFWGCSSLTSVTIPNSVTSIGGGAFSHVPNIVYSGTATGSPWGARSMNGYVDGYFVYSDASKNELLACSAVATGEITIPNSVTSIGREAFYRCTGLTSVTIPNSVTSIGDYAFNGCTSGLTSVTIPNSVTSIGDGAFYCCSSLTSITIPNSVTSIGRSAFYGCNSLTSVTIGNSVTSIEEKTFSFCTSLATLELPASLKVIEASAFEECEGLKTITCYGQRPPTVKEKALESVPYSTIVYVPADYLSTYKMHDVWGLYDVRPLGAATVDTQDMAVTPHENTADIVWPTNSSASTYELVISKDGEVICTLIFNANGQLTSIAFAPARYDNSRAPEQTEQSGFSFTVTGLNPGTTYNYTLTVKDAAGKALDTKTGTFTTEGETATEDVIGSQTSIQKIFEDGKLYILLPDGTRYDATGKRVK